MRAWLFIGVLAALGPGPAAAGIVNVQSRFATPAESGLHAALDLTVDWRTGNSESLTFKAGLSGVGVFGDHLLLGIASGELGVAGDTLYLARIFEHLRYRYQTGVWVQPEAFVQHEADAFKRLSLRALGGLGARANLVDGEKAGVSAGLALMVEHERLSGDTTTTTFSDAGATETDLRISTYLLGRVTLMENLDLVETLYLQPRLDDPSDLRILNETSLSARANEYVRFSLSFSLSFDARPPETIASLDTQLKTTIGISF